MHNLDTSAQAARLMRAAATLEANGASVYRLVCFEDVFAVCTAGSTRDGFTATAIITMAEALRGPAAATEEATR
jgi:hypothetical protein